VAGATVRFHAAVVRELLPDEDDSVRDRHGIARRVRRRNWDHGQLRHSTSPSSFSVHPRFLQHHPGASVLRMLIETKGRLAPAEPSLFRFDKWAFRTNAAGYINWLGAGRSQFFRKTVWRREPAIQWRGYRSKGQIGRPSRLWPFCKMGEQEFAQAGASRIDSSESASFRPDINGPLGPGNIPRPFTGLRDKARLGAGRSRWAVDERLLCRDGKRRPAVHGRDPHEAERVNSCYGRSWGFDLDHPKQAVRLRQKDSSRADESSDASKPADSAYWRNLTRGNSGERRRQGGNQEDALACRPRSCLGCAH